MEPTGEKHSNTTLVKVKFSNSCNIPIFITIQIQHLLKLNRQHNFRLTYLLGIQIQHLLKLNYTQFYSPFHILDIQIQHLLKLNFNCYEFLSILDNSNTTLVKVKYYCNMGYSNRFSIQIQHLLKLNQLLPIINNLIQTIQIQHLLKLNTDLYKMQMLTL